jgi:hypothetical protein
MTTVEDAWSRYADAANWGVNSVGNPIIVIKRCGVKGHENERAKAYIGRELLRRRANAAEGELKEESDHA